MSPVTFDNPDTVAAFEADFSDAMTLHGLDESHRETFREHWAKNPHWHGQADAVRQVAQFVQMVGQAEDPESAVAAFRTPPSTPAAPTVPAPATVPPLNALDKDGRALYRRVEELEFGEELDFFVAFAKVTGNADFAAPRPVALPSRQATDPKAQEENRRIQEVMREYGIGYIDAVTYVRHARELAEAKKGPEPTDVPWLDSRPLSAPPRPWADEDWQRDSRRAAAASLDVDFEQWKAAAELGRDLVGEQAEKARADRVAELEMWGERFVRGAQETEAKLRAQAIEDELDRQAKGRLKSRGQVA